MSTIRIIIEIEAGDTAQTSIKLESPNQLLKTTTTKTGAIDARVRRLVNEFSENEIIVVKSSLQASMQGTKIYRKQLMEEIGFTDLLQFNGVLAWITRKYRKLVVEPDSYLIETAEVDNMDDYSLEINSEVPEEVLNSLKTYFELT